MYSIVYYLLIIAIYNSGYFIIYRNRLTVRSPCTNTCICWPSEYSYIYIMQGQQFRTRGYKMMKIHDVCKTLEDIKAVRDRQLHEHIMVI